MSKGGSSMNNKSSIGVDVRLAYLLIYLVPFLGSFLFLIFDYNDKTIRRHCLMSLFTLIGVILINMVLFFFAKIPVIGVPFSILIVVLYVLYGIIMIIGLARALGDSFLRIPFFYDLAEKCSK
jgi:uncharacterized membrane protein